MLDDTPQMCDSRHQITSGFEEMPDDINRMSTAICQMALVICLMSERFIK
jgi:hypothetical protein